MVVFTIPKWRHMLCQERFFFLVRSLTPLKGLCCYYVQCDFQAIHIPHMCVFLSLLATCWISFESLQRDTVSILCCNSVFFKLTAFISKRYHLVKADSFLALPVRFREICSLAAFIMVTLMSTQSSSGVISSSIAIRASILFLVSTRYWQVWDASDLKFLTECCLVGLKWMLAQFESSKLNSAKFETLNLYLYKIVILGESRIMRTAKCWNGSCELPGREKEIFRAAHTRSSFFRKCITYRV